MRLRPGERAFVAWGGLKGAVPILLAAFVVDGGIDDARRLYELVFVVVLASVLVQGATIPFAASPARGADAPARPFGARRPVGGGRGGDAFGRRR